MESYYLSGRAYHFNGQQPSVIRSFSAALGIGWDRTALLGAVSVTWFVDFFQTLGEAGLESTERVCPYGLTNSI